MIDSVISDQGLACFHDLASSHEVGRIYVLGRCRFVVRQGRFGL